MSSSKSGARVGLANFVACCLLLLSASDLKKEERSVMVDMGMENGWLTGCRWFWVVKTHCWV